MDNEQCRKHYSEEGFWEKVKRLPGDATCGLLRSAMTLYVLLKADNVSVLAKGTIIASLGYFIVPVFPDICPDFLPGGFVDDLAVMSLALANLRAYLDPEVEKRVAELLPEHCKHADIGNT